MRVFCRLQFLLILTGEIAFLPPECGLWPHPVLAQENKPTQVETIVESARDATTRAIGAALQANAASAVKILLSVPPSAFTGADAEWRSCMIDRFGPSRKPDLPAIDDPWIARLIQIYTAYWQRSLAQTAERVQAEQELRTALAKLLAHSSGSEPEFDALEKEIGAEGQNHGFHALFGVTAPLRELMAWKKQTVEKRQVHLPEGPYSVKVTLMDDFLVRGWGYYTTCGRRSTGGWATEGGLFAVVPAYKTLDDETFSVRFLAHETQHFADKQNFGHLEGWELEYRAKLTELALAVASQDSTLELFCENQSPVNDSAHAFADFHVIRDIGQRLGISDSGLCGPAGARGQTIRDAARALLVSDSDKRKRLKD
jgi:hypothetical protein